MQRRAFLALLGAAGAAAYLARPRLAPPLTVPVALAAADRLTWWDPAPEPVLQLQQPFISGVILEWRYVAGRIKTATEDFGFVCSLVDYREIRNPLTNQIVQAGEHELIVMREDFKTGVHATTTYRIPRPAPPSWYSAASAAYSFAKDAVSASMRLDSAAPQSYRLSVSSPELTLTDLTLLPVGELISEGGDGDISSGSIGGNSVRSDYYADWVEIERGGQPIGYARLDMQTIRPETIGGGGIGGFSHHWFAVAGTLANGEPFWVSAWEIVSGGSTVWCVTIARNTAAGWAVESYTEEPARSVAHPLDVTITAWQEQPTNAPSDPDLRTGQAWRLTLGAAARGDLLDVDLAVPAGQFITGTRIGSRRTTPMQEAVGKDASGEVRGVGIATIEFVVAESTYSEPLPAAATPTHTSTPTNTSVPVGTTPPARTATPTATATRGPSTNPEPELFLPFLDR